MPEGTTPATLKCKICGGDIVNDYLAGACVCSHCGNKWSLQDLIPDFSKYTRIVEKMNRAKEMLAGKADVATAGQAMLMFKTAAAECASYPDAIASDLMRVCKEGEVHCEQVKHYAKGMSYFDKKTYRRALTEFEQIPDYQDSAEKIEKCKKLVLAERKKRIPLAIVMGLILPTILCIFLREKVGLSLAIDIPLALVLAAGCAYAIYLEGTLAIIIQILSVLSAVPLILFLILAYGFHMDAGPAAITAVVAPIAVIVIIGFKPERKQ